LVPALGRLRREYHLDQPEQCSKSLSRKEKENDERRKGEGKKERKGRKKKEEGREENKTKFELLRFYDFFSLDTALKTTRL
jgi:hypothetical protein